MKLSVSLNIILMLMLVAVVFNFRNAIFSSFTANKQYNIVMFGNSLIGNANWSELLNRNDVLNSGVGGITSSQMLIDMDRSVLRHKPKICFVETGGNDIYDGINPARTIRNYKAILNKLKLAHIEAVLHANIFVNEPGDSTINSEMAKLNILFEQMAKDKGLTYIDLSKKLSENERLKMEYTTDGCHINNDAYSIWAEEIKKVLTSKKL